MCYQTPKMTAIQKNDCILNFVKKGAKSVGIERVSWLPCSITKPLVINEVFFFCYDNYSNKNILLYVMNEWFTSPFSYIYNCSRQLKLVQKIMWGDRNIRCDDENAFSTDVGFFSFLSNVKKVRMGYPMIWLCWIHAQFESNFDAATL